MERYLVYDAGCAMCSQLAETIEAAAGGKLTPVSFRDAKARELLDRARPEGWEPAPYLVFAGRERVRAWTGTAAAVRLTALVGPRGAWRIWAVARRHGIYLPPGPKVAVGQGVSRRRFLQLSASAGAALAAVGLLPSTASACIPCETCGQIICRPVPGQCDTVGTCRTDPSKQEWVQHFVCRDSHNGQICHEYDNYTCYRPC